MVITDEENIIRWRRIGRKKMTIEELEVWQEEFEAFHARLRTCLSAVSRASRPRSICAGSWPRRTARTVGRSQRRWESASLIACSGCCIEYPGTQRQHATGCNAL